MTVKIKAMRSESCHNPNDSALKKLMSWELNMNRVGESTPFSFTTSYFSPMSCI